MTHEQGPKIAARFRIAQSWWLASELVRRHPRLLVVETHPGGGMYDCLTLVDPGVAGPTTVLQLNRNGRIHVDPHNSTIEPVEWTKMLAAENSHSVLRSVEGYARLRPPVPRAPTIGPRAMTYRVLAHILACLVDDRSTWDARSGCLDWGYGLGRHTDLDRFPSIRDGLHDVRESDLFGEPAYRYWLLHCGDEAVAVLDTDGWAHFADRQPVELVPAYRGNGSRLTSLIGSVFGHVLP
ncbi:TY-Chap2 family putative peptide chaperone [Pseudonocardia alni]|uniref:TY-Chap2 family putative peptide chaperone n=1 Tax=Pseudonocardia alni TaxID=33907 RepID=UPI001AD661D9|nr:hypothetical protein [Pseudonocardia alni]MBO4238587.1 hypothetical protein [Pseudonocardia alni]